MRLVFIHGAGCLPSVFSEQLRAFPGSIAPALPGHGVPGEAATIAQFADALAPQLGDGDILCGSSMGGAVALELAVRQTPGIRALVTIGSGARLRVAPAILEGFERDFAAAVDGVVPYFFAEPTPERLAAAAEAMRRVGQAQSLRDFRACDAFDATPHLSEIALPFLALVGEHDRMTPPKYSTFLADRIDGGQARILPGTGHLAFVEDPAGTNAALHAFVEHLR